MFSRDLKKWFPFPELAGEKRIFINGEWVSQNDWALKCEQRVEDQIATRAIELSQKRPPRK
jgi:hypothetical protein